MNEPRLDTSDAPNEPPGDAGDALEQRTIAWLFGEDDEDPGLIAAEAVGRPGFVAWLDGLATTHAQLKVAITPGSSGLVQARLAALRDDITRRRDGAVDWPNARVDNVRSLAAARARPGIESVVADPRPVRAQGTSLRPRPVPVKASRATRIALIGSLVLAAAAAIFLVMRGGSGPPDVDARIASLLVAEVAPESGFGFAGASPPTARDRGFLLGAVIDLSRPRKDKTPPAAPETSLARDLVDRTLVGLSAPEDAEARRQRVISGCAAILIDPADRSACEKGLADYIARRDAFFSLR